MVSGDSNTNTRARTPARTHTPCTSSGCLIAAVTQWRHLDVTVRLPIEPDLKMYSSFFHPTSRSPLFQHVAGCHGDASARCQASFPLSCVVRTLNHQAATNGSQPED